PAHLGYSLTEGLRVPVVTLKAKASGITVSFTKANDGIYGNNIEGYEIYRADDGSDNYELIATLNADTLKYKDKNVDKNGKYSYKVASIVNGKTSYFSLPVSNE
ncbi:MAG: fibronectin type III domain-containing protein, partial [Lachnospiraceae bacterium]|nr:fibronectin type III domain-containing protein [Lachnospiraceae bacterium]